MVFRIGPARRPGAAYLAGAPLLIAHRGGGALAPENTLVAFRRALEWWGADILELDVQPTRDGEAIVFHDATLDRTTDGNGPVADHTLADIRGLDAGHHFIDLAGNHAFRGSGVSVATLGEVLAAFPVARVNVEVKDARAQQAVMEAVRNARAEHRVLIAAGRRADRGRFSDYPGAMSASGEELRAFYASHRLRLASFHRPIVDALQLPERHRARQILSPRMVREAQALNLAVHVWTVNERRDMHRLLDWGVDGIITDRPDLLAGVLHERTGRPLPPGPPGNADADAPPLPTG